MSDLRVNTISNAAGTGPVTLTGQSAAKAHGLIDKNNDFSGGIDETYGTLNVSSITDIGVGITDVNIASSFASRNERVVTTGSSVTNKLVAEYTLGGSASIINLRSYDADTATIQDQQQKFAAYGDLA